MNLTFMGDVHAEWGWFQSQLALVPPFNAVIQTGDFFINYAMVPEIPRRVHFVHGNHDYMPRLEGLTVATEVHSNLYYRPAGTVAYFGKRCVAFLGGADSVVDRAYRTEGRDWWPSETVSYTAALALLDYDNDGGGPIDILVTHTPPQSLIDRYFGYPASPSSRVVEGLWRELGRPTLVSGHMHPDALLQHDTAFCLPVGALLTL